MAVILNPNLKLSSIIFRVGLAGAMAGSAIAYPGGVAVVADRDGRSNVVQEWRADLDEFTLPEPRLRDYVEYQTIEVASTATTVFTAAPMWITTNAST